MATVIDALVVMLGLDAKPFKQGAKEVDNTLEKTKRGAKKTGQDIERSGKQGAEFFNQLRKSALQFFAVLTVGRGIADFTRNVVGMGAQLDRVAANLETSASKLSRWTGAVRQSGGTAEGFLGSVQGLSAQLTQLKLTGDSGILPYIQALGVSLADTQGKARPFDDILLDISERLKAMPSRADAFNIGKSLGLDEGTVNLLLKGREEVKKLLAAQKEYSDSDAKAARQAEEGWERTKQQIERTTQALVIKLLPTLQKVALSLADFAKVAVPVIGKLVDGFLALNEATSGWLLNLGLALGSIKAIAAVLGTLGFGGAAAAGTGAAAAGAAGAGAAAGGTAAAGALAGPAALVVAHDLDDIKRARLYDKAKAGDKKAARELAEMQLNRGVFRSLFGSPATEQEISTKANEIMGVKSDRGVSGRVTQDPISSMLGSIASPGGRSVMSGATASGGGSSPSISIGEVKVYTQATDAAGIARDMRGAIIRQADTGMR